MYLLLIIIGDEKTIQEFVIISREIIMLLFVIEVEYYDRRKSNVPRGTLLE